MREKTAYLSAPAYNEPQQTGVEKITSLLTDVGKFELLKPGDGVSSSRCVDEADVLFVWLDGLMPPGVQVHAIGGSTQELRVPVDPDTKKIMSAGMMATGKGLPGVTKGGLILPGQTPPDLMKDLNIGVKLTGNQVLTHIVSPPLNIPDPGALVDIGMAFAYGTPVIGIALGPVMAGAYVERIPIVASFEALEEVLQRLAPLSNETVQQEVAKLQEESNAQKQPEGEEETSGTASEGPAQ